MATLRWRPAGAVVLFVAAALGVAASDSQAQPRPELDARIEIVWPHGGANVLSAEKANIAVYLFERGTRNVFCEINAAVQLAIAIDNDVGLGLRGPPAGTARRVTQGGVSFIVWDFNDVDVSLTRNPNHRLTFWVASVGLSGPSTLNVYSNVWAHAANALTTFPIQNLPRAVQPFPGKFTSMVDSTIQIVWPHGGAPVTQADKVNITAIVFHHWRTLFSVPPDFDYPVVLLQSLNQEPLKLVAMGQKRLVTANGITYPVWDFNNIDVSAAKDPQNKYFFMVRIEGIPMEAQFSNIWVHGGDGRTYFPQMDVTERGCP